MPTYRVSMNDRRRIRTVTADNAADALKAAYGQRFYGARLENCSVPRDGVAPSSYWQVTVRIGPRPRDGMTPVQHCWATVYLGG